MLQTLRARRLAYKEKILLKRQKEQNGKVRIQDHKMEGKPRFKKTGKVREGTEALANGSWGDFFFSKEIFLLFVIKKIHNAAFLESQLFYCFFSLDFLIKPTYWGAKHLNALYTSWTKQKDAVEHNMSCDNQVKKHIFLLLKQAVIHLLFTVSLFPKKT